jgi:hypothetical protein
MLLKDECTHANRTIELKTIAPLNSLAERATKGLITLVSEVSTAKRLCTHKLGFAKHINVVFLQAIKSPDLHEALLSLKALLLR